MDDLTIKKLLKMDSASIVEALRNLGKDIDYEFKVTPQAEAIIYAVDNFPVEHFKEWWKKNYGQIHGGHLHHYFCAPDGIHTVKHGK